jgi:hypothetical protein
MTSHTLFARTLRAALLAVPLALAGCASETLFQSSFNSQAVNAPPTAVQTVGTAQVAGDPGSVIVVGPLPGTNENWLKVSRANAQSQVSTFTGILSKTPGVGSYGFLCALFIPSGSGLATVEFATAAFGAPASTSFLHLDFMQNNTVRIDDGQGPTWGTFPRDQFFTLSVTLEITAASSVAHLALFGTGTSGTLDYTIPPPFNNFAQQFGQVKIYMGFPWTGSFDAADLLVTHRTK